MDVMFPVEWRFGDNPTDGIGGPAVDDAGTVYIVRDEEQDEDWPDGNYDAPMLVKKTTLAELVAYCLEGWRTADGYTEDGHVPASDALAAALRAAADMLDAGKRPNVEVSGMTIRSEATQAACPLDRKVMRNSFGDIPVGTKVYFRVENQNMWSGGNEGVLEHDGFDFVIRTPKGIVTINKGYDAYINTVRPVTHNAELRGGPAASSPERPA